MGIKDTFYSFAGRIFEALDYVDTLKTINVVSFLYQQEDDIGDREKSVGVKLSNGKNLFCVKLEYLSNAQIDYEEFEEIKKQYQYDVDSKMMVVYVKKELFQAIYFFTTSEKLSLQVSNYYLTKPLNGSGVLEALFDIYHVNYHFIEDKRLKSAYKRAAIDGLIDKEIDVLYFKYRDMISSGARHIYDKYIYYQGYKASPIKDRNINKVFRLKWNGAIFFLFDLYKNSPLHTINRIKSATSLNDKFTYRQMRILENNLKDGQLDVVQMNVTAFLDNSYVVTALSAELGFDFTENNISKSKIISKTPLFTRDADFDFIIESSVIPDILTSVHKKPVAEYLEGKGKITPDIIGRDINNAYISHLFGEFTNGHAFIIAPTRTGKSVFAQKMISQIIDFNVDAEEVKGLDNKYIRIFDVGESALRTSRMIQRVAPLALRDKIIVSEETGDNIRFSLLDFTADEKGMPSKDEVSFSIAFMSFVLEVEGAVPLDLLEQAQIRTAIDRLYKSRDYKYITVFELQALGYNDYVDDILSIKDKDNSNKYNLETSTKDLEEKRFRGLKIPLLSDLISDILLQKDKPMTSKNEKNSILDTVQKLEALAQLPTYTHYSSSSLKACNYYYRDFARLKQKNEKLFVQMFWISFRLYFNMDSEEAINQRASGKGNITPKYYYLEEVHNFFGYESFGVLLERAIREAGKAGIRFFFVSQNLPDIPSAVLSNIATKIILTNPENKEEIKQDMMTHLHKKENSEAIKVLEQTVRYQALFDTEVGAYAIMFDYTDKELKLYQTTA